MFKRRSSAQVSPLQAPASARASISSMQSSQYTHGAPPQRMASINSVDTTETSGTVKEKRRSGFLGFGRRKKDKDEDESRQRPSSTFSVNGRSSMSGPPQGNQSNNTQMRQHPQQPGAFIQQNGRVIAGSSSDFGPQQQQQGSRQTVNQQQQQQRSSSYGTSGKTPPPGTGLGGPGGDSQQWKQEFDPVFELIQYQPHKTYVASPPELEMIFARTSAGTQPKQGHPGSPGNDWDSVWLQLSGTSLSMWSMKETRAAAAAGAKVPPTYFNVTDSSLELYNPLPPPPHRPDSHPHNHVFSLNTAGSNRLLFSCPTDTDLIKWSTGLRLAAWERSRLEEIYTGHLIRSGRREPRSPLVRGRFEGWVRVRVMGSVDWHHRLWLVLSDPAAVSTEEVDGSVRRRSLFGLSGDKHEQIQEPNTGVPMASFYNEPRTAKNKTTSLPVLTMTNVTQVYAMFPEHIEIMSQSNLMKVMGRISGELVGIEGGLRDSGWAQIMPESPDDSPASTPLSTMMKWITAFHDAFHLYGRPNQYTWEEQDPKSLFFAYPHGELRGDLFLSLDEAKMANHRLNTPGIRAQFCRLVQRRLKHPAALPPVQDEKRVEKSKSDDFRLPPLSFNEEAKEPVNESSRSGALTPITESAAASRTNSTSRTGHAEQPKGQMVSDLQPIADKPENLAVGTLPTPAVALQPSPHPETVASRSTEPTAWSQESGRTPSGLAPSLGASHASSANASAPTSVNGAAYGQDSHDFASRSGASTPGGQTFGGPETSSTLSDFSAPPVDFSKPPAQPLAGGQQQSYKSPAYQPARQASGQQFEQPAMRKQQSPPQAIPAQLPQETSPQKSTMSPKVLAAGAAAVGAAAAGAAVMGSPHQGSQNSNSSKLHAPKPQRMSSAEPLQAGLRDEPAAMYLMNMVEDPQQPAPPVPPPATKAVPPIVTAARTNSNMASPTVMSPVDKPAMRSALTASPDQQQPRPEVARRPSGARQLPTFGNVRAASTDSQGKPQALSPKPATSNSSHTRSVDSAEARMGQLGLHQVASGPRRGSQDTLSNSQPQQGTRAPQETQPTGGRPSNDAQAPINKTTPPGNLAPSSTGHDIASDAAAYLAYADQPPASPIKTKTSSNAAPIAAAAAGLAAAGGAAAAIPEVRSSFAPSKAAAERRAKAEAQAAEQQRAMNVPGGGKRQGKPAPSNQPWSDDEDESDEEEPVHDSASRRPDVSRSGSRALPPVPRPGGDTNGNGDQYLDGPQHQAPTSMYGYDRNGPPSSYNDRAPQSYNDRAPQSYNDRGSSMYNGQSMATDRPRSRSPPAPHRHLPQQPQANAGSLPAPPAARQNVWNANFAVEHGMEPKGGKFIELEEPSVTLTKAFAPGGLLQAGIQDKEDRSAKRQEEVARETGGALVNVPAKPPPPQTGLVGAVAAHERDRKNAGGIGATLTDRDRERRIAEERQRKIDELQRQQMDHMSQYGGMGGPQMGGPGMMPYGAPPQFPPYGMNPMGYPGGYPGMGGMMSPQAQQQAMMAAQMAYQQTMMAMSQAGSQMGDNETRDGRTSPNDVMRATSPSFGYGGGYGYGMAPPSMYGGFSPYGMPPPGSGWPGAPGQYPGGSPPGQYPGMHMPPPGMPGGPGGHSAPSHSGSEREAS